MDEGASWPRRLDLGAAIKEKLFDTNLINPESYKKEDLEKIHQQFEEFALIDEEEWFVACRRAASEYKLAEDLNIVNGNSKTPSQQNNRGHNRPTHSSSSVSGVS